MSRILCILGISAMLFSNENKLYVQDSQTVEILQIAMSRNPSIMAANEIVISSSEGVESAGRLPDPKLTGGYFISPVETKTGPQEWKIGVQQSIPWVGKLLTDKKISIIQKNISENNMHNQKLSVQTEVVSVLENLRFLKIHRVIIQEDLDILSQLESVILSRYTNSLSGHSQLLRVQVEILRLKDEVITLDEKKSVLTQQLEAAVGIAISDFSELYGLNELVSKLPRMVKTEQLNNPKLQIQSLKVDISKEKVKKAKYSYFPDFVAGVDYIHLGDDPIEQPIMVKVGITIPLWWHKNRSIVRQSSAIRSAEKFKLEDWENQIAVKHSELYFKLNNFKRKYSTYMNELIPLAVQSYQSAETAYLTDATGFSAYLETQQLLLGLRKRAAELRMNYFITAAEYFELNGHLITGESL